MEDTYILIGLSVLFICCIYLFYLNFKNSREREYLQTQINDLKFELTTRSELLNQQHAGSCDLPTSMTMFMQQQQQQHPMPVITSIAVQAPSVKIVDDSDEQPIDLAPEDIENINKLSEEINTYTPLNNLVDDLDDIELDDVDIEQFNVDDLDLDLDIEPINTTVTEVPQTTTNNNVDTVDSGDAESEPSAADVVDINLKTLTKNELLNSSVKYLKLIAKNCGVSSRGNKDALIAAISKKLEL